MKKLFYIFLLNFLITFSIHSQNFKEEPLIPQNQDLDVVYFSPQGQINSIDFMKSSAEIIIIFNQPLIPLSTRNILQEYKNFIPFKINPPLEGEIHWYGTNTVGYKIKKGLIPGKEYIITIDKNIKSIYNKNIKKNKIFKFSVEPFQASYIYPDPSLKLSYNTTVYVDFNYPIELNKNLIKVFQNNQLITNYQVKSLENSLQFDFKNLKVDADIKIQLSKDLLIKNTNISIGKDFVLNYKTKGPVDVSFVNDAQYFEQSYQIGIQFSNDIDLKKNLQYILVIDAKTGKTVPFRGDQKNLDHIEFISLHNWDTKPSNAYAVVVKSGLKDNYGTTFNKTISYRFELKERRPYLKVKQGEYFSEACGNPKQPIYFSNVKEIRLDVAEVNVNHIIKHSYDRLIKKTKNLQLSKNINDVGFVFIDYKDDLKSDGRCNYGWIYASINPMYDKKIYNNFYEIFFKDRKEEYSHLIQFTDLGLTVKQSPYRTWFFLQSLSKGQFISDANVMIYNSEGRLLDKCITDKEGFCEIRNYPEERGLNFVAINNLDRVLVHSRNQINYESIDYNVKKPLLRGVVFFDRKIYKPGEKVYFKAILNYLKDGKFNPIPKNSAEFNVSITNSRAEHIYKKRLMIDESSAISDELLLHEDAPTGIYYLRIEPISFFNQKNYLKGELVDSFQIVEFRPLTFTVITPQVEDQLYNNIVPITLEGRYLFGAPLINSRIEVSIFSDNQLLKKDIGKLNKDGTYRINFQDVPLKNKVFSYVKEIPKDKNVTQLQWFKLEIKDVKPLHVEAKIYDMAERYITKNIHFNAYPSWEQPKTEINKTFLQENETLEIRVKNIHAKKQEEIKNQQLIDVYIFKEEWDSNFVKNDEEGLNDYYTEGSFIPVLEFHKKITPEENKVLFKPQKSGSYKILVINQDRAFSLSSFYVSGSSYAYWEEGETLKLLFDKSFYEPGDIAKLLIQSPFKNAKAIITIEQEDLYEKYIIENIPSSYVFNLPVKQEYLPGVHVSVMLYTPRTGYNKTKEYDVDLGKPKIKMGTIYMDLSTKSKRIPLDINTNCNPCEPKQTITINLKTVANANIALSVADRGVLDLIDYHFPDAVKEIYTKRPYNIKVYDNRESLLDQYLKTSMVNLLELKTGGGGDESANGGLTVDSEDGARKNFQYTAYWNPNIKANENGEAKVTFKLPNNITTFRIMAVAYKDTLYATKEFEFKVQKPLIVLPVIPNFIRPEEKIFIGGLIINNSNQVQNLQFEMKVQPNICKVTKNEFSLKPFESSPIFYECFYSNKRILPDKIISKTYLEEVEFALDTKSKEQKDRVILKVPVMNEVYKESLASSGIIQKEREEMLLLPDVKKNTGFLTIEVFSKIIRNYKNSLEYFEVYPYLCLEQRASAFYINYLIKKYNLSFNIKGVYNFENSKKLFLDQLKDFQDSNGGFKSWKTSSYSNLYLTLYVLDILRILSEDKYIDLNQYKSLVSQALNYIKKELNYSSKYTKFYYFESLLYASYVLYSYDLNYSKNILTRVVREINHGRMNISSQSQNKNREVDLSFRAKGYLLILLYKFNLENNLQNLLIKDFENSLQFTTRKVFVKENLPYFSSKETFYSNVSTLKVWLEHLMQINYNPEIIFKVFFALVNRNIYESSSYDEALLAQLMEKFSQKYESIDPISLDIFINNNIYKNVQFSGDNIYNKFDKEFKDFSDRSNKISFFNKNPLKIVYYTVSITYNLNLDDIKPISEGFYLEKEVLFFDENKNEFAQFSSNSINLKNGNVYLIKLKVVNDKPISNYVIRDPISSLVEVVNMDFKTESERLKNMLNENPNFYYYDTYFSEIYKDRYQILGEYLNPGIHEFYYFIRTLSKGEGILLPTSAKALYEPEIYGRSNYIKIKVE